MKEQPRIAVIGLGYVGWPLAAAFAEKFSTLGFDLDEQRVQSLLATGTEVKLCEEGLENAFCITTNSDFLTGADVYIVAVPTPVNANKLPDLTHLRDASRLLAGVIEPGTTIIYESTVYPGVTEEVCVPILETSGLKLNQDFVVGYSPERINPGDAEHGLGQVIKVTSGSTPEAAQYIDHLYSQIIPAGTFRASSIKVAEAAKVIENTQRDLNIALMNELAIIFAKLGIDTADVLAAARTKWNFLPFEPGLVGGHCIGVDPYYLTHRAEESGYHPDVILAGRRINDGMGTYIGERVVRLLARSNKSLSASRVLILGATFKENCEDLRNTRVTDIVAVLKDFSVAVEIWEPWGDSEQISALMQVNVHRGIPSSKYDAVLLAVAHRQFRNLSKQDLDNLCQRDSVIFDVKSIWPKEWVSDRL